MIKLLLRAVLPLIDVALVLPVLAAGVVMKAFRRMARPGCRGPRPVCCEWAFSRSATATKSRCSICAISSMPCKMSDS